MNHSARIYVGSVALILIFTALAKLITLTGAAHILSLPDPIFGISYKYLLFFISLLELGVSAFLLRSGTDPPKLLVILLAAGNFAIYRTASFAMNVTYCPCVGNFGERLGLSEATVQALLTGTVAYMVLGALYLLAFPRLFAPHTETE